MMTNAQIRRTAKDSLRGSWGLAIGVILLNYLLTTVVGSVVGWIPFIGWIAIYFVEAPLAVGLVWFFLAISRKDKPEVSYLFSGFRSYWRTLAAYVLVSLFIFLWSLLLIVPGIIKMFSYSQTFMILRDNPNISALDAITESRHMMDGYKGKFFGLSLYFLLWYIIPIIVLIIGMILLMGSIFAGYDYSYGYSMYDMSTSMSMMSGGLFAGGLIMVILGGLASLGISLYVMPYMMTACGVFYDDLTNTLYTANDNFDNDPDISPYGVPSDFNAAEDPFENDQHPDGFGPNDEKDPFDEANTTAPADEVHQKEAKPVIPPEFTTPEGEPEIGESKEEKPEDDPSDKK
ncbi:DUF975 family protein [Listeria ilorinensis]|uniref:DUF975 family protein n=1 Tax=Listeria ilorinensis TaxID=2867439 RepID=UPI003EB70122